ncbi:Virulence factor Mce family protein [uncultured Mycobacterium sp.]|uniref:Virulence factor Mce family protein n=1 Tax=uncultured Mycobacterium sp. TaxID=171292 RepID=A0A1Y5P9J1_9MYCO|nr:Virulence factor Mce family protein [uncultured Mycobacterium sp.]
MSTLRSAIRPAVGLASVILLAATVGGAVIMFRGDVTSGVPITVISPRAGLVMNPGAKVKMRSVQVGTVSSIDQGPNGQAVLHLSIDPAQLPLIPGNVQVGIASPTVFGAKLVELTAPADPSAQPLRSGQVIDVTNVTVEINTVFQQLTSVLSKVQPEKLNEILGALAGAMNARGEQLGQMFSDFDTLLAQLEPGLDNLRHDITAANVAAGAYADAAPDLVRTADNATRISQTVVDRQDDLDALLLSAIGLADVGSEVVDDNQAALIDVLHLLVPSTDLTNRYRDALNCTLAGLVPIALAPPQPDPGAVVSVSFTMGLERYRYPGDLPKVAAKGGPHCADQGLPHLAPGTKPPFLVTDIGANPAQYGNQGVLLNSDGLKQILYGPLDGPPRNSAQIGQPG